MPRLSARDRCHQVHHWLREEFPTRRGTRLRVGRMPALHDGDRSDGVIVFPPGLAPLIWINSRRSASCMLATLLHEYAHALVGHRHPYGRAACEHSDGFYRTLGKIERAFDSRSQEKTDDH